MKKLTNYRPRELLMNAEFCTNTLNQLKNSELNRLNAISAFLNHGSIQLGDIDNIAGFNGISPEKFSRILDEAEDIYGDIKGGQIATFVAEKYGVSAMYTYHVYSIHASDSIRREIKKAEEVVACTTMVANRPL
jgi:hypothetical protein